jgi:hypothetical protein
MQCDGTDQRKGWMESGSQSSLCRRLLHLFPSHSSRSRVVISIVDCRPDPILSLLDVDRGVIAVGSCTKKEGRGARFAPRINQRLGSSARTPHPTFSFLTRASSPSSSLSKPAFLIWRRYCLSYPSHDVSADSSIILLEHLSDLIINSGVLPFSLFPRE